MQNKNLGRTAVLAIATAALAFTYAASAANIGFVVNTGNDPNPLEDPFDAGWVARLGTQGHTVTVFNQADGLNPAVATMDLFIVSQDVASGTAWSNFGNVTKPLLSYEYGIYDEIFGASNGNTTGIASNGVSILNPAHPLSAGLSGNVSIYTGGEAISKFTASAVSSGTQVIALSVSDPTLGVFAVLEPGAIGGGGNTWSARRMALPCYENWNPALVTADGWKLLDGAVAYGLASIPEPSSIALLGLGLAVFLARRQHR